MGRKKQEAPILVRPDHEFTKGNLEVRKKHFNAASEFHWHDYYEMEILFGGDGSYCINGSHGEEYPLYRGSAYLVTPADFHQVRGDFDVYNLAFNDAMASPDVMSRLLSKNSATVVSFGEDFPLVEHALEALWREYTGDAPLREHMLRALLDYVLVSYTRKLGEEGQAPRPEEAVMRVVSYIKFNFKNKITLADAARAVHLSPNYIGGIFAEKMGMSFHSYLMQTRLAYAKNLLSRGNITVEEAGFCAGFSSQPYFSNCFRKQFGVTPSGWLASVSHLPPS